MERGDFRYEMGLFGMPWDGGILTSDQEVAGSSPTGGASLFLRQIGYFPPSRRAPLLIWRPFERMVSTKKGGSR